MKVTIDTKEDSVEDIRKVLHILTNILQQKGGEMLSNAETGSPVDTSNLMSMFDDNTAKPVPDTPPDFGSFLSLTGNKVPEKRIERARVEVY